MTDIKLEVEKRVQFIKDALAQAGARGIVFGNSGGKDSALVGILCKMACDDTLAVMMPCFSKRNFGEDLEDADALAKQFAIETITVDLTGTRAALLAAIEPFGGGQRQCGHQHCPSAADDHPLCHRPDPRRAGGRHRQRR